MREQDKNILREKLKEEIGYIINELGKDGLFEEDILEELYLSLWSTKGKLYVGADFNNGPEKRITFKNAVNDMIDSYDNYLENCSKVFRQAATEFEEAAKMCTEAANKHATSGWPLYHERD